MHGGISWGGGSQWRWENVLDLCRGSADAGRTIQCFQNRIEGGKEWSVAVEECTRPLSIRLTQPIHPQVITDVRPVEPRPVRPPAPAPGGEGGSTRTILPAGRVEITSADGRRTQYYSGGFTVIYPDGTQEMASFSTGARPPTPPSLPDSAEVAWLETHSERLLSMIQNLVDNDSTAMANYMEFEGMVGVYDQIVKREQTIAYLVRN